MSSVNSGSGGAPDIPELPGYSHEELCAGVQFLRDNVQDVAEWPPGISGSDHDLLRYLVGHQNTMDEYANESWNHETKLNPPLALDFLRKTIEWRKDPVVAARYQTVAAGWTPDDDPEVFKSMLSIAPSCLLDGLARDGSIIRVSKAGKLNVDVLSSVCASQVLWDKHVSHMQHSVERTWQKLHQEGEQTGKYVRAMGITDVRGLHFVRDLPRVKELLFMKL